MNHWFADFGEYEGTGAQDKRENTKIKKIAVHFEANKLLGTVGKLYMKKCIDHVEKKPDASLSIADGIDQVISIEILVPPPYKIIQTFEIKSAA